MLPEFFSCQVPTRVIFGDAQLAELGEHVAPLGVKRFFLVTDKVLSSLGFVDRVREGLQEGDAEVGAVFDGVKPNSEVGQVEAAAAMAREAGCTGVIGLGGGSALDTAKAVAILMTFPGDLLEYEGAQILEGKLVPQVAIPTTAGTGSEVTNCAVILCEAEDRKISFVDDNLYPDLAILDPSLTTGLPPRICAATGMDALTHAIEAYVDQLHSPFSDALALQAVELIATYLPRAVKSGAEDGEARGAMLTAASLAGIAFTHSMVGVVHAVSHALGGVHHCPHGEANAVMLPEGMRFNLETEPERFARLNLALGGDPSLETVAAAEASVERVLALRAELAEISGLPVNLRELGVPEDGLDNIADKTMEEGSLLYNPRPVEESDVQALLRAAY
jgi:alcohol dehydrogenase class IV